MKVTYGAIVQRASGRFGGTVHSNWKGVDVVRRFAKPSNPNTGAQQEVRAAFSNLTRSFNLHTPYLRAAWDSFVTGKPLINRNAWLASNVAPLTTSGDAADIVVTPGDSSTLPLTAASAANGVGQTIVTCTAPAIPTGWAIERVVAVAVESSIGWNAVGLPVKSETWYEGSDTTDPYAPTITGLPAETYEVFAFIMWTAPDQSARYSAPVYAGPAIIT